ncbi:uncharacterized protein LOC143284104 [Babylonia areolata]|uniref:uncharacterized protein LOC143284104 n=1 Tax=Babylonia areolata TaxID=304850 RepID=UPI003FD0E4CF
MAEPAPTAPVCQNCNAGEATTQTCATCSLALCTTCHQSHSHDAAPPAETPTPTSAPALTAKQTFLQGGGDRHCPKHRDQLLMLYCCQCEAILCIVCRLTAHEGHKIEDLVETGQRARAELSEELQAVTRREHVLRAFLAKVQDFEEELAGERRSIEEKVVDRANELRHLVERAQNEALEGVAAMTQKALDDLREQAVPVQQRHSTVDSRRRHLDTVIRDGEDNEAVSLLAQLRQEAQGEDRRAAERSLSSVRLERGTVRYDFRMRAVKLPNILAFIGSAVEGPVMQARASATAPEVEVSLRPGSAAELALNKQRIAVRPKSSPVELFYSKNPNSTLSAMHLMTTEDEVWLNFNPGGNVSLFGLFDDDGQMKELHTEDIPTSTVLITCDGDTALSMDNGRWVRPGSEAGALEGFTPWGGAAVSKSATTYLLKELSIFRLLSDALPPQVEETATYTAEAVGATFDVSETGQFVATTIEGSKVRVFDKLKASPALRSYADYVEGGGGVPADVCFCVLEGKEVLLVAFTALNTVHVLDHRDGCCFLRTLETERHPVVSPCRLSTNHHGRVWVGCNGGKVVIFDV